MRITPLTSLCFGFVLLLSYFTYFHNFGQPAGFFWDENYHVASAEKYLNGVFFMEQHPPLGKLLIAAGEKILNVSTNDTQFLDTNYATGNFEDGFSIVGYRFLPALLSWLTAPVLFFIFLLITRSPLGATLLSFLYVFDNALIVHGRGAMLEGPMLFFAAVTVLLFLLLLLRKKREAYFALLSLLFGITFCLTVMTKLLGLILILLVPTLLLHLYPSWKRMGVFLLSFTIGALFTFVTVWQIHFSLGNTVRPGLEKDGWYGASEEYKDLQRAGKNASLLSFPVMLRDSLKYTNQYNEGVPELDLCKPNENGSPFFFWPFGARAINYRWTSVGEATHRYLYLQVNPVTWFLGLLGVFLGLLLFIAPAFVPMKKKLAHRYLLGVFLMLYISFMIAVSQIDRVMYLYHYFTPLLFSFILFGIVIAELEKIGNFVLTGERKMLVLMLLAGCIFLGYQIYRPLTYYEPITNAALEKRAIFPLWELTCTGCEKESLLVKPVERDNKD